MIVQETGILAVSRHHWANDILGKNNLYKHLRNTRLFASDKQVDCKYWKYDNIDSQRFTKNGRKNRGEKTCFWAYRTMD